MMKKFVTKHKFSLVSFGILLLISPIMVWVSYVGLSPFANKSGVINASDEQKSLLIFHGWPTGLGVDAHIVAERFSTYDAIVLGECLEERSHPAHELTTDLVANLSENGKEVYGYIDLGHRRWDENTINNKLASWKAMGVEGIYWDNFSKDFASKSTSIPNSDCGTSNQDSITWTKAQMGEKMIENLSKTHNAGLKIFINLATWDEMVGEEYLVSYLSKGDILLADSLAYNSGKTYLPASGGQTSLAELFHERLIWKEELVKELAGVDIACISTVPPGILPDPGSSVYKSAVAASLAFGCNYNGISDASFASSNPSLLGDYYTPWDLEGLRFTRDISGSGGKYVRKHQNGELAINFTNAGVEYTLTSDLDLQTAEIPVVIPKSLTHTKPISVSMSSNTVGAIIYYTIDGKEPSKASRIYSSPFQLSSDTTIKALAYKKGMIPSDVIVKSYDFNLEDQLNDVAYCPQKKYGDSNCNGSVNVVDLDIVEAESRNGCQFTKQENCGTDADDDGELMDTDFNGDGFVDENDVQIVINSLRNN